MADWPSVGSPSPVMISSYQQILGESSWFSNSSSSWPTANTAIFVPFTLGQPALVVKLWAYNGATVAGNTDIGIYDESFVRRVSKGPTAQAGANIPQEFDITDTLLQPGRYYMALVSSSATATFIARSGAINGAADWRALGLFQQAAAGTLPAAATPAVMTVDRFPVFGLSLRTLI